VFKFDKIDVREAGEAGGWGSNDVDVESPVAFGVNPERSTIRMVPSQWRTEKLTAQGVSQRGETAKRELVCRNGLHQSIQDFRITSTRHRGIGLGAMHHRRITVVDNSRPDASMSALSNRPGHSLEDRLIICLEFAKASSCSNQSATKKSPAKKRLAILNLFLQ
jgi:hypothetical protein